MTLNKLHDPKDGQMRVIGLMSGTGSNLRRIIEIEKRWRFNNAGKECPYHIAVIFSDTFDSNVAEIGKDQNLPVVLRDLKAFYAAIRHSSMRDMYLRKEFDAETVKALSPYEASVAAYAGYMSIATKPLIDAFLGINVHPADLSIKDGDQRKYTGDHAVRDAILQGERNRISLHRNGSFSRGPAR